MIVRVKLHAHLRRYAPSEAKDRVPVEVPQGARVADLLERLGIPPGHAGMIVAGDERVETSALLQDGQEVDVFPPLAGGR